MSQPNPEETAQTELRLENRINRPDTVLIIEDETLAATLVNIYIKKLGFNTEIATTGIKGWELILANNYAGIITDLNLPGLSGIEIFTKIRQELQDAITPLIFHTASVDQEQNLPHRYDQNVGYSPKPIGRVNFEEEVLKYFKKPRIN